MRALTISLNLHFYASYNAAPTQTVRGVGCHACSAGMRLPTTGGWHGSMRRILGAMPAPQACVCRSPGGWYGSMRPILGAMQRRERFGWVRRCNWRKNVGLG